MENQTSYFKAKNWAQKNFEIVSKNNWVGPEIIGLRTLSYCLRAEYNQKKKIDLYKESIEYLSKGIKITERKILPRFEIEIWLEYIRWQIIILNNKNSSSVFESLEGNIERVYTLIETSGFHLYFPEIIAAKGWLEYFKGKMVTSKSLCKKSYEEAIKTANINLLSNPLLLLSPLNDIHNGYDNKNVLSNSHMTYKMYEYFENNDAVNENLSILKEVAI